MKYEGWELHNFDSANLYRAYQFSLIRKQIKGNILEVGPGNCIYINKYMKVSNSITFIEPTNKYFKSLKKKFKKNKKVTIKKNLKNLKKNSFDTIIYLDVLEHIKNDKEEINKAYNLIKKSGTIIICVPAFQFLYSIYDKKIGHYRRYSKNSFIQLLKKCRIENYKIRYFDFVGFCLILMSKLLNRESLDNFSLKIKLWNFFIPISIFLDVLLMKYFFGKSLLVKIKKKNYESK